MGFKTTPAEVSAEKFSSHGRSDMVVRHEGQVFVLEFKVLREGWTVGEILDGAIRQIREKKYAEQYRGRGEPVHLVGMVFGEKARELLDMRVEEL